MFSYVCYNTSGLFFFTYAKPVGIPGTQSVTAAVGCKMSEASSSLLHLLTHFIPLDL